MLVEIAMWTGAIVTAAKAVPPRRASCIHGHNTILKSLHGASRKQVAALSVTTGGMPWAGSKIAPKKKKKKEGGGDDRAADDLLSLVVTPAPTLWNAPFSEEEQQAHKTVFKAYARESQKLHRQREVKETTMIYVKQMTAAALPATYRKAAEAVDMEPVPYDRHIWTDTPPIPGYER